MEKKRLHLKIHGEVQGVNFRYYTMEEAAKLDLKGWVKNGADDTVVVQAEGNKVDLEELLKWCRHGPALARVEKVEIQWQAYQGDLEPFHINL